ncbi:MAG: PAS domain-containing sensor histidine kinase [Actinomycetes bacterium]
MVSQSGTRSIAAIGLLRCDRSCAVVDASSKACRLLGRRREELIGSRVDDLIELAGTDSFTHLADRLPEAGLGVTVIDALALDRFGVPRPTRVTITYLPGSANDWTRELSQPQGGFVIGLQPVQSIQLIEHRQSVDRGIDRLHNVTTALVEQVPDLIMRYRFWPSIGFEYVSSSAERMLGYSPTTFYANPEFFEHIVVASASYANAIELARAGTDLGEPLTIRVHHRDGSLRVLDHRITLVHGDDGNVVAVDSISRDVTETHDEQLELATAIGIRRRLEATTRQKTDMNGPVEILRDAVEAICGYLGWPAGHAVMAQGNATSLRSVASWPGDDGAPFGQLRQEVSDGPWSADVDLVDDLLMLATPIVTALDSPMIRGRFSEAATSGLTYVIELPVILGDGVGAVLELFSDEAEPPESPTVAALIDVSVEIGRLIAVSQEVGQLRLRDLDRQAFLAQAAHELRGPIGSIALMASALAGEALRGDPEQLASSLRSLASQADRIATMTNRLLALSQLEEGRVEVQIEAVGVRAVVQSAVSALIPSDRARVQVEVPNDLKVMADGLLLDQVIANLVVNACRHGGVEAQVAVAARSIDGDIRITVEDDGPGVPQEVLDQQFQPNAHALATAESAGLGLALVMQMVAKMGGMVSHEAIEPSGARFIVRLPAA